MGFSTSAVFLILMGATIGLGVSLLDELDKYNNNSNELIENQGDYYLLLVDTKIEIISASYSDPTLTISVKNSGNSVINPNYLNVFVDSSHIYDGTYIVSPSNRYLEPDDSITITYTIGGISPVLLKVITENGIYDQYDLTAG